ncbi:unnamed protein product [Vicia faba]|uniref:Epidermal patterning factor-like protein n=1 Tax=Vicia faba TaxID=3906 RepID=A0AAV1AIE8_VICFA|nr:unnamed protein product [Vicia faba]
MRFDHHAICISLFFLVISSCILQGFVIDARKNRKESGFHQTIDEEKMFLRAQIGSRPPKCDRRCRTCGHCEAIQVPTNPQVKNGKINSSKFNSIAYSRGKDNTNYKPMSWKCKCGSLIFNP